MCVVAEIEFARFLLLAGAALALAYLVMRFHRYWSRRIEQRPGGEASGATSEGQPRRERATEQGQQEVELHEMARELSARLDSKMRVLQHLIRDAEQAAARLEATIRGGIPVSERRGPNDSGVLLEAQPASPRRHDEIYALAAQGLDAAEIARRIGTPVGEVELILSLRKQR